MPAETLHPFDEGSMGNVKHTPGPWKQGVNFPTRVLAGEGSSACIVAGTCLPVDEDAPNEREIANARLIAAAPALKGALATMLDLWGGYECPEVDAAIAVMQEIGEDRWSMQAQMDAAKAEPTS